MLHVITPYGRGGPSSRVRVFEWLDRVRAEHEVTSYIGHHNARASAVARRPRTVWSVERRLRKIASARPERLLLHREASPLSRGRLERRLLAGADFSVYDFDDALHTDWGDGGILRRLAPKAPKTVLAVQHADRVIAASPTLVEWAAKYNRDVVFIPSCVAPEKYVPKRAFELADPPRLGWIGSADNETYLKLIEPALQRVHQKTGARLTLIGTTEPHLGAMERFIDRVAWSEPTQYSLLNSLDVGLMPVPDEPYERGKAGYKLLQYAATGTALIASPVGVNSTILHQLGMPGPANGEEWVDALLELLNMSSAARAVSAAHCRRVVDEMYSFDAWQSRWERAVGLDLGDPP